LRVSELARALKSSLAQQRYFVILDCCFSEAAARDFIGMGAREDAVAACVENDFSEVLPPKRGGLLLCACPARQIAIARPEDKFTSFSGALIEVLREGDERLPAEISFNDLRKAIKERLCFSLGDKAPQPVLHPVNQLVGDLSRVPAFLNSAVQKQRLFDIQRAAREAVERALKERAEQEAIEREQARAEHETRERARQQAAELAAKEKTERERREHARQQAAELAAKEKAEREARERARQQAAELAAKEKAEREARERARQQAAEVAAKEKAQREARERAAYAPVESEAPPPAIRKEPAGVRYFEVAPANVLICHVVSAIAPPILAAALAILIGESPSPDDYFVFYAIAITPQWPSFYFLLRKAKVNEVLSGLILCLPLLFSIMEPESPLALLLIALVIATHVAVLFGVSVGDGNVWSGPARLGRAVRNSGELREQIRATQPTVRTQGIYQTSGKRPKPELRVHYSSTLSAWQLIFHLGSAILPAIGLVFQMAIPSPNETEGAVVFFLTIVLQWPSILIILRAAGFKLGRAMLILLASLAVAFLGAIPIFFGSLLLTTIHIGILFTITCDPEASSTNRYPASRVP
jgi:hypothetical protein